MEKDIRLKSMVQHKAPIWINTFATDSITEDWEYPKAEALKQQILNNQAIVEKIKEFVRQQTVLELDGYKTLEECEAAGTSDAWWLLELNKIFNSTVHSGSKID